MPRGRPKKSKSKEVVTTGDAAVNVSTVDSASGGAAISPIELVNQKLSSEYGKNIVVIPSNKVEFGKLFIKDNVISTGNISLDHMTGIGGIPRGRIIEVYGREGAGKCLDKNTLVHCNRGLLTLGEIFEDNNFKPTCTTKDKEVNGVFVRNRYRAWEKVKRLVCNNKKPVLKIRTRSGFVNRSTYNHPWLILNKRGFLVWRNSEDLRVGDYLVSSRDLGFGNIAYNDDEMYALGLLVADGSFQKNRIEINNNDPNILGFITSDIPRILDINYKEYRQDNTIKYSFSSKEKVNLFYKKYGYKSCVAKDKYVSRQIRMGNQESIKNFLQGYVDCECSISKKNNLEVSSASFDLLFQVKLLLQNFGIISILSEKKVKKYPNNKYWRLSICGKDFLKYFSTIGTRSDLRQKQFMKHMDINTNTNFDIIPNIHNILKDVYESDKNTNRENCNLFKDYINGRSNISYRKLIEMLDSKVGHSNFSYLYQHLFHLYSLNYFYDPVVEITKEDPIPTFDISLPQTHSFHANGLISHNTSFCVIMSAIAQARGAFVLYVDAEHRLDLGYAAMLGLDINDPHRFTVIRPNNSEHVYRTIDEILSLNSYCSIIVDSVPSILPKSKADKSWGESSAMARQALEMNEFLQRCNPKIAKSQSLFLFTNQLRAKSAGKNQFYKGTTGGNALPYYSTLRINISWSKKTDVIVDENGEQRGAIMEYNFDKTNTSAPPKPRKICFKFGKGFWNEMQAVEVGIQEGIIVKAASWLSFKMGDKEIKGQGKFNFTKLVEEDSKLYKTLVKEIKEKWGMK